MSDGLTQSGIRNISQPSEMEKKMMALMRERYSIDIYRGKALCYLWVDLNVALS